MFWSTLRRRLQDILIHAEPNDGGTAIMKSHREAKVVVMSTAAWLSCRSFASGGMPSITLTDVARMRLSTVSLFLLLIVLSAWGIRWLWNGVRKDFPKLPKLTLRGAIQGVLLWGLVFVVVLTMISGARELMTPGAWQKNGLTYSLADQPQSTSAVEIAAEVQKQLASQAERISRLQQLHIVLREWSQQHDGQWPMQEQFDELPETLRLVPGDVPAQYIYRHRPIIGNGDAVTTSDANEPLIIEPAVFGDDSQLALYRSGVVGPFRSVP